MGFFDDLIGAVSGQQKASPYTASDTDSYINQAGPLAAQANINYNNALQPAYTQNQLNAETQYDPNSDNLRHATTNAILDQLNLGGQLPADVIAQINQSALQSGGQAGIAGMGAGRNLTARDLGLTSLDLLNNRINSAKSYALPNAQTGFNLFHPQSAFNPEDIAGGFAQDASNKQAHDVQEFGRTQGNKIALFNTFGRLAGTGVGAAFGGGAGAKIGGDIGGSLINNPYSANNGGANSGQSSIFQSLLGGAVNPTGTTKGFGGASSGGFGSGGSGITTF